MTTIYFEDRGQNVREWDVEDGMVVGSRPSMLWLGTELAAPAKVGEPLRIKAVRGIRAFFRVAAVKQRRSKRGVAGNSRKAVAA